MNQKQKNKRKRNGCDGKQRFDTLKEAQAALASLVRRRTKQGQPIVTFLRAYGCACGGFHYGNSRRIDWDAVAARTNH